MRSVLRPARGSGGGSRIRTGGILLAKQALYQLSYTPKLPAGLDPPALVGLTRVELVTSSLSGTRSNQLSYKPLVFRKGGGTLLERKRRLSCFNLTPRRGFSLERR